MAVARSLPAKLPDLIASLHPMICWSSGISDLPVQLRSFKVCARAGASIQPGDRTANDNIAAAVNVPKPKCVLKSIDQPCPPINDCWSKPTNIHRGAIARIAEHVWIGSNPEKLQLSKYFPQLSQQQTSGASRAPWLAE